MFVFVNNCETVLTQALGELDTTLATDGSGDWRISGDSTRDVQMATLTHPDLPGVFEIVAVIGLDYDAPDPYKTLRVVRGREETPQQTWPAGTKVQARITAGMLESFPQQQDRFVRMMAPSRGNSFMLGNYPVMLHRRAQSTNGAYFGWHDGGFTPEAAGTSHPVVLGEAPEWGDHQHQAGQVVRPSVPDGFQYWLDLLPGFTGSQAPSQPQWGGPLEATTPATDWQGRQVGWWVATAQPIDTHVRFQDDLRLVVTEVGFISRTVDTPPSAPVVSIGDDVNPTRFADHVALDQITSYGGEVHRIPVPGGGATANQLTFRVDTAAAGGSFQGRFYWRGFFLEAG